MTEFVFDEFNSDLNKLIFFFVWFSSATAGVWFCHYLPHSESCSLFLLFGWCCLSSGTLQIKLIARYKSSNLIYVGFASSKDACWTIDFPRTDISCIISFSTSMQWFQLGYSFHGKTRNTVTVHKPTLVASSVLSNEKWSFRNLIHRQFTHTNHVICRCYRHLLENELNDFLAQLLWLENSSNQVVKLTITLRFETCWSESRSKNLPSMLVSDCNCFTLGIDALHIGSQS